MRSFENRVKFHVLLIGVAALGSHHVAAFIPTRTDVLRVSAPPTLPRSLAHTSSTCQSFHRNKDVSSASLKALPSPSDITVDPVLIQHIGTGGVLTLVGDVLAQSLTSKTREISGEFKLPPEDWDKIRTAAFVAFGGIYTGGVQHFIFEYLNAAYDDPIQRLLLAQFFFIPFCYYPTFLLMVPALRAGWEETFENAGNFVSPEATARREQLFSEVFGKIPSTLVRNWCFWLPVQFVQFSFIPPNLQITYVAAFGVIWNAILSWSTSSAPIEASEKDA